MWSRIPSHLHEELLEFVECQTHEVAQSEELSDSLQIFGHEFFCKEGEALVVRPLAVYLGYLTHTGPGVLEAPGDV
eukprot:10946971-Heterocapsa_arctica.AAC.1